MNATDIIEKYYSSQPTLKHILLTHSRAVADKALYVAQKHPELCLDTTFLEEASLMHDIGIIHCDAPGIHCTGRHPYICHGYLGAEMLRAEGLHRHALVCERHTGMGITLAEIKEKRWKIPQRDMVPISTEEQVICFADKFFSKTHLDREKTVDEIRRSLSWLGADSIARFDLWCHCFL